MMKIENAKENLKYLAAWIVLLMHAAGMIPALMNPHEEIQGNGTEQMAISEDGQAVYRLADQMIIRTGRIEIQVIDLGPRNMIYAHVLEAIKEEKSQ